MIYTFFSPEKCRRFYNINIYRTLKHLIHTSFSGWQFQNQLPVPYLNRTLIYVNVCYLVFFVFILTLHTTYVPACVVEIHLRKSQWSLEKWLKTFDYYEYCKWKGSGLFIHGCVVFIYPFTKINTENHSLCFNVLFCFRRTNAFDISCNDNMENGFLRMG